MVVKQKLNIRSANFPSFCVDKILVRTTRCYLSRTESGAIMNLGPTNSRCHLFFIIFSIFGIQMQIGSHSGPSNVCPKCKTNCFMKEMEKNVPVRGRPESRNAGFRWPDSFMPTHRLMKICTKYHHCISYTLWAMDLNAESQRTVNLIKVKSLDCEIYM